MKFSPDTVMKAFPFADAAIEAIVGRSNSLPSRSRHQERPTSVLGHMDPVVQHSPWEDLSEADVGSSSFGPLTAVPLAILIQKIALGDHQAFEQLYVSQATRLQTVAYRILRHPSDAEDAVQDTLLQVWRNAHQYDPGAGEARNWLSVLTRYRALDILKRRRRDMPEDELAGLCDCGPTPADHAETAGDIRALHNCLLTLDLEIQSVLTLAFVEDLPYAEVAARVGKPEGTVKSQIRRNLRSLKQRLDQSFSE